MNLDVPIWELESGVLVRSYRAALTCRRYRRYWTWPSRYPGTETKRPTSIEAAADQAIAVCGGDAREAVKALIVANRFLETDLEKLKAAASMGYSRGQPFNSGQERIHAAKK